MSGKSTFDGIASKSTKILNPNNVIRIKPLLALEGVEGVGWKCQSLSMKAVGDAAAADGKADLGAGRGDIADGDTGDLPDLIGRTGKGVAKAGGPADGDVAKVVQSTSIGVELILAPHLDAAMIVHSGYVPVSPIPEERGTWGWRADRGNTIVC